MTWQQTVTPDPRVTSRQMARQHALAETESERSLLELAVARALRTTGVARLDAVALASQMSLFPDDRTPPPEVSNPCGA